MEREMKHLMAMVVAMALMLVGATSVGAEPEGKVYQVMLSIEKDGKLISKPSFGIEVGKVATLDIKIPDSGELLQVLFSADAVRTSKSGKSFVPVGADITLKSKAGVQSTLAKPSIGVPLNQDAMIELIGGGTQGIRMTVAVRPGKAG